MMIDDLFDLVSYRIYPEPHIVVNADACRDCVHKSCTFSCPARCYTWSEERARVEFAYEACLECGSCLLICDREVIDWHYPPGGYGVRYRLT